jgi:hypothetical protein
MVSTGLFISRSASITRSAGTTSMMSERLNSRAIAYSIPPSNIEWPVLLSKRDTSTESRT